MLGIGHQHGRFGSDEPGTDSGVFGRKRRGSICRTAAGGSIRIDRANAGATSLRQSEPAGQGAAARVGGPHDRPEPDAGGAADRELCRKWPCEGGVVSTQEVRQSLSEIRRGTAGLCGQESGNLSGPATKRILEREYSEYGQAAFERLAQISVAQIYRVPNSEVFLEKMLRHREVILALHPNPISPPFARSASSRFAFEVTGCEGMFWFGAAAPTERRLRRSELEKS